MFKNSIKLNYISYYKINKNQKINYIYKYIFLFKKYNKILFKYQTLPTKKKYFCLVKSPKCYKIGKFLINYKYFNFFFYIFLKNKVIDFNNTLNYFSFLKKKFNVYQTLFAKNTKISIKLNINYNLKILYVCIGRISLPCV